MKILFVCKGNVGRSQMAEALYKIYGKGDHKVSSAGIKLSGPEQPLKELPLGFNVTDVIKEEGLDITEFVRKQLTPEMVKDADKVVLLLEEGDMLPDFLQNNPKIVRWSVPDPKGTDLENHRKVKDQIKALILENHI